MLADALLGAAMVASTMTEAAEMAMETCDELTLRMEASCCLMEDTRGTPTSCALAAAVKAMRAKKAGARAGGCEGDRTRSDGAGGGDGDGGLVGWGSDGAG
jgi:hypothetical protein